MLILSLTGCETTQVKRDIDQNTLEAVSHEANKRCPMDINEHVRLENTEVFSNFVFQYNFILLKQTKDTMNVAVFKRIVKKENIKIVRTDKNYKFFRDNSITIIFAYRDKNGSLLFKVRVTPAMYR